MKTRQLFHLAMALNLMLAALPLQAVQAAPVDSAAPADLLQFTAGGHALGFSAGGMYAAAGTHALHVDFLGANDIQPNSDSSAAADGNAAPLSRVKYVDLWDGITLAITADAGAIYTTAYTLATGADPADIRLRYNAPLTLNEDGTLSIAFETGVMTESAPVAWQEIDGERVPVDIAFRVDGRDAGFVPGVYDPQYALTIDPTLTWNTFLGASGEDKGSGIAVDGSGNVYVTGDSCVTWGNPVQAFGGGNHDAFVAKLDSSGNLTWNTFLGGSGDDYGYGIAVDGGGNPYVTGQSSVAWGSPLRTFTGGIDAFAAEINPSTGALLWNTFLGGSGTDSGRGIAVGGSSLYVAGYSTATWTCIPPSCVARAFTAGYDAFAAKLTLAGGLTWNAFLGGDGTDYGYGITVDASGYAYVTGFGNATWGTPVRAYTAGWDAFAAKLNNTGGGLVWNTFLGGDSFDYGYGIAVDGSGNVFVAGHSNAAWDCSPVSCTVRGYTAGYDAFAAGLDSSGTLIWNTFLGGSGEDRAFGIGLDGSGNPCVIGYSSASWGTTPVRAYSGGYDAFLAKLDSAGNVTLNTFLGGSGNDQGAGIALNGSNIYAAGYGNAAWGSPLRAYTGENDALAAKLTILGALTWNTFLGGGGDDWGYGVAVDGDGNVYVTGTSISTWGSPVLAFSEANDAFVAKLDSAGGLLWNTFLGAGGIDSSRSIAVDGSGNVYVAGNSTSTWGSPIRAFTDGFDAFAAKLNSSTGALIWNTFLGGSANDFGAGVAADGSGNVYVAGYGEAAWGSPVRAYSGGDDGFSAKLDSAGNLIWNTFLGGSGTDEAFGIAVYGSANVYAAGISDSSWGSPVHAYGGGFFDGFAAKLNSSTGALTWNTFLGGSGMDSCRSITVDGDDNALVAGNSNAAWGAPIRAFSSGYDAFLAKLDSAGNVTWNTFLGGSGSDDGEGIVLVGNDAVYLTGYSGASWGSPERAYTGSLDGFAVKLNSSGELIWNTFLGGSGTDTAYGIAVDSNEGAYVIGASSAAWGVPVRAYSGGEDVFVANVNPVPPAAFNKAAPVNGSFAAADPTLSWGASSEADSYEYCIDTTNNSACDASWISNGTSQSAALSGLANDTTYYWQVRATNAGGTTNADGGAWWSFTTPTFADVPITYWAWSYIERLFSAGITGGCASSPLRYCPSSTVTRAQMAIFLERGMNGSAYTPPPATGTVFSDVSISYWAAAWIEKLSADGITGGCGGGKYCPDQAVTRAEMAIFLLRAEHGSTYTPPAATGTVFGDVPISHWAGAWIEQLSAEGITGGCGGGNYCPNQAVTRAEMAVFLVRTFGLP